jgi:hypothetical protein
MRTRIYPAALRKPGLYKRLLIVLCWLKVIPVSKRDHRFKLFSVPTLLSTLWGWLLLSYYIYADIYVRNEAPSYLASIKNESTVVLANNGTDVKNQYDFNGNLVIAFLVGTFLLIILLPGAMGHFFAHNDSMMLNGKFTWPYRGWMLVLSALVFMLIQTITLYDVTRELNISNIRFLHYFLPRQLVNSTVSSVQFLVIMLISSTQSSFIRLIQGTPKHKIKVDTITDLLQDYENIRQGIGPFYALELCIHSPNVLIFGYFGLVMIRQGQYFNPVVLWSIGSIAWSSLTIVHICLMSDICFQALQELVPSIR